MKQTTRVSFDTIIDGNDVCIEFNRTTVFTRDPSYGADADGRRGLSVDFVDEDDYADVEVSIDGAAPIFLNQLTNAQAVQQAVDKWMEMHAPEPEEQPEPDYDDRGEDE